MTDILTASDKTKITGALKAIAETKKDITKAKLAGIDVSAQETQLIATEQQLLKIKQVYFPG